jgi:hypothetical protein
MEKSKDIINISDLPEFARTELIDFYEFLKAKHKKRPDLVPESSEGPLCRFVSNPIKVDQIKRFSRDQMHER